MRLEKIKEGKFMQIRELLSNEKAKKVICLTILAIIALLSMFVISKPATSPESYKATIESIDDKKATVMGITASAATASTVLAAIPGDVTTPISNQIMEISSYLLIVVCVLVLEKSLLTVMGYLSFNILIPIACGMLGIYTFFKKEILKTLAIKFVVFALVIVTIIPLSLKISDLIYEVNKTTIDEVATDLDESIMAEEIEDNKSWLEKILDKVKNEVLNVGEKAKQILNRFIDAIAIFIITYCAVPIVVVLLVIWFVRFLFGIAVPVPNVNKIPLLKKHVNKDKTSLVDPE